MAKKSNKTIALFNGVLILLSLVLFASTFLISSLGVTVKIYLNLIAEALIVFCFFTTGIRVINKKKAYADGIVYLIGSLIIITIMVMTIKNLL